MKSKLLSGKITTTAEGGRLRRLSHGWPRGLLLACALLFLHAARAELQVEVTRGVEGGVPVAVAPFRGEPEGAGRSYHRIVSDDLAYSGLFSIIETGGASSPPLGGQIDYNEWLSSGVEKFVIGEVETGGQVRVELHDALQQKRIKEFVVAGGGTADRVAHQVSDVVYEELTGIPGIFSTLIAFIRAEHFTWRTHKNTLYVSDADGRNAHVIYSSPHQLMSPAWAPDLKTLAYVSYENGRPEIILQTLATGERKNLGEHTGPANLPSWSDDGKRLAYVSSEDGNPDIYVIELETKLVRRVTDNAFIDTEPVWAPDGTLIFTSDRSGNPQLYRVDGEGGAPRRITFHGSYNSDANVSPSGDRIVFLSQRRRGFVIVIKDFTRKDGAEVELVSNPGVEGARFTANGQLLGYITDQDGKSAFGLMTTDGVFGGLIPLPAANVRGAAWSPFTW